MPKEPAPLSTESTGKSRIPGYLALAAAVGFVGYVGLNDWSKEPEAEAQPIASNLPTTQEVARTIFDEQLRPILASYIDAHADENFITPAQKDEFIAELANRQGDESEIIMEIAAEIIDTARANDENINIPNFDIWLQDQWLYQDVLTDFMPTLESISNEFPNSNHCVRDRREGAETEQRDWTIVCDPENPNTIDYITLPQAKGVTRTYNFEEGAVYFATEGNRYEDKEASLSVLPFSQIDADRILEMKGQKNRLEAVFAQNVTQRAERYQEQWPKIMEEIKAGPAALSADPAP